MVMAMAKSCTCQLVVPPNAAALSANTAVKAAPAFGLRWTLRDKASRSAPYLQRWASLKFIPDHYEY